MSIAISTVLTIAYALFLILVAYGIELLARTATDSEAGRFHRVIACTVAALGALFPLATVATVRHSLDIVVLVSTGFVGIIAGVPLALRLRRSAA
jgi:hypothetical protein